MSAKRCAKIVIVSDDERLGRAIELNLLALSSCRSNPVVALAQASLPHLVGQVPILIISEHPFRSDLAYRIHHLSFPFDLDRFCERVRALLHSSVAPEMAPVPRAHSYAGRGAAGWAVRAR
jgi:hypothetical protein